jgi:hypothetical protein
VSYETVSQNTTYREKPTGRLRSTHKAQKKNIKIAANPGKLSISAESIMKFQKIKGEKQTKRRRSRTRKQDSVELDGGGKSA